MRVGIWNVRRLYRADSITAAARDLARMQEVGWDKEGTVKAGDYNFFYGKGIGKHKMGTGFLYTTE
jgi:hypothetical protein